MKIEMYTQDVLKQIDKTIEQVNNELKELRSGYAIHNQRKSQLEKFKSALNFYKVMCLSNISDTVILDSGSYYTIYEEQYEE